MKNELQIDTYYVSVKDENVYGKEREIVLCGLDISNDLVVCSIGITGTDDSSSLEFAKLSKEIFGVVASLELPIKNIEIHQYNSHNSRFHIICSDDIKEQSVEEIEKLVTNEI